MDTPTTAYFYLRHALARLNDSDDFNECFLQNPRCRQSLQESLREMLICFEQQRPEVFPLTVRFKDYEDTPWTLEPLGQLDRT